MEESFTIFEHMVKSVEKGQRNIAKAKAFLLGFSTKFLITGTGVGIIAESSKSCLKDHSLIRGPVLWQGRSLT